MADATILSDNALLFETNAITDFAARYGTKWRTIAPYSPQSNGRAERMVGTIKNAILKMAGNKKEHWDASLPVIFSEYQRRPLRGGPSPFELMFGVLPRMGEQRLAAETSNNPQTRAVELLACWSKRSDRIVTEMPMLVAQFQEGELVLLYNKKKLTGMKLPFGEPLWFGPYRVTRASHPRYELRLDTGKTRRPIHARRLAKYYSRDEQ